MDGRTDGQTTLGCQEPSQSTIDRKEQGIEWTEAMRDNLEGVLLPTVGGVLKEHGIEFSGSNAGSNALLSRKKLLMDRKWNHGV